MWAAPFGDVPALKRAFLEATILISLPVQAWRPVPAAPSRMEESTEADETHLVAVPERLRNAVEHGLQRRLSADLGKVSLGGHMLDGFEFVHVLYP
jgi:hypothetical protein